MIKNNLTILPILILFVFLIFPINNFSQNSKNLATKGNFSLTEDHVQFYVKLLQFVVGQKIKKSEVGEIRSQAIREFNTSPQNFFTELNQFYSYMNQLYRLTDPIKIADGRMFFIGQFYKITQATPANKLPSLIKVSNRYVKVLHYNPQTQIALTNKDIQAVLGYIDFTRRLSGYAGLSYAEKSNFTQHLPTYYSQLTPQHQAAFVIMPIVWKQMEWQWSRLTPQQKQQVIAQHRATNMQQNRSQNQGGSGGNYQNQQPPQKQRSKGSSSSPYLNQLKLQQRQQLFNTMQNMNANSYMTSMNIIENMGNTGNYWEMQY